VVGKHPRSIMVGAGWIFCSRSSIKLTQSLPRSRIQESHVAIGLPVSRIARSGFMTSSTDQHRPMAEAISKSRLLRRPLFETGASRNQIAVAQAVLVRLVFYSHLLKTLIS